MKRASFLLVIFALGACSRTPVPEAGELRVIPISGDVSLLDGGETTALDEATTVQAGVGLQTGSDGRAQVEFPGGSSMELGPGATLQLDDREPEVAQGSVLVRAGVGDVSLRAGAASIEATDSVFWVDRQTSVVLGVYKGEATIPGAGVVVPSLRQATVLQNGSTAGGYEPLRVDPNDPWDIRFLGEAIDLGFRLLNLERGLTRQLPATEEERAVSAALERSFSPSAIRAALEELGDAAKVVVAAVVAREIERMNGGSRARILSEVVELRALVANWTVIVAQWGLADAAGQLLDQLGELILVAAESAALPVAAPPTLSSGAGVATSGGSIDGAPDSGPGGPGPRGGDKGPPGGNAPPPAPPDESVEDEPPAAPCANEIECVLEDLIGDGLGVK